MGIGLIGYKCGMTRFFNDDGVSVPVTVIKIYSNIIIGLKCEKNCGYTAVQVSASPVKKSRLSKSVYGLYKKIGVESCKYICEFRVNNDDINNYIVKDILSLSIFNSEQYVSVTGISKGKGFSGVVRRYNFSMQRATHGNSRSHRVPGSIGQCQTPGKVFKGKKMPGRLGNEKVTVKNLRVIKLYYEKDVILLRGSIPGFSGSKVIIKKN